MDAHTFFLIAGFIVVLLVNEAFHRVERTRLLHRIMAKDYKDYRYFEDKWQGDLKEVETVREEAHAEVKKEAESGKKGPDLTDFEEPWEEESAS
jgi:hypothetical protein